MTQPKNDSPRKFGRRKIAALAAGLLVVGVGATYTLASWNDTEWVWGSADGDNGVGTAQFEVQQNTAFAAATPNAGWGDFEANPGDELIFSTGALSLSPGDTVYAPVALRTTAATSLDGETTLAGAVAAATPAPAASDVDGLLWAALRVSVYTASTAPDANAPTACTAGFATTGWTQILNNVPLGTAATATQALDSAAGSVQHYCFAVSLPAGASSELQGRSVAPAWAFNSESVAP